MDIDSTHDYKPLWFLFRFVAPIYYYVRTRPVYIYTAMLQLLVTIMFPLHLLLALPSIPELGDLFRNMTMITICVACSGKHLVHLWHMPRIREIMKLLQQLDGCIKSNEEIRYYQTIVKARVNLMTRTIYYSFSTYYIIFLYGSILVLFVEPRKIIFPGWFPFDWQANRFYHLMAYAFQFICIPIEVLQALINDIFTPVTLCYMGGHIHLFGIRMSRLGFDKPIATVSKRQLFKHFEEYVLIIRLHQLTRETISNVQLIQLTFSGLNLCIILSYILLYVQDTVSLMYNAILFAVVCIQLFPSCYFATVVTEEAAQLPYAIFSGNWYEQSAQHRRNLLIFIQFTLRLKSIPMMAGNLFVLNLNTFFSTVKLAYSLFAIVMRAKVN